MVHFADTLVRLGRPHRSVSGIRTVPRDAKAKVAGINFDGYGSSHDRMRSRCAIMVPHRVCASPLGELCKIRSCGHATRDRWGSTRTCDVRKESAGELNSRATRWLNKVLPVKFTVMPVSSPRDRRH
eukprot:940176-Prorocentrum_minimum.AAC.1